MLAARMIKRKHAGAVKVPSKDISASPESEKRSSLAEFKDKYVRPNRKESRFYRPIDRTYTWMLKWSMGHRWAIVLLSILVIVSTVNGQKVFADKHLKRGTVLTSQDR